MAFRISRSQRLMAVIGISCSFFLAEISGMYLSCFYFMGPVWLIALLFFLSHSHYFPLWINFSETTFDFSRFPSGYVSETLLTDHWLINLNSSSWFLYAFSGVGGRRVSLCMSRCSQHFGGFWWTDNCQLNDLVGFVVALVAVRVGLTNTQTRGKVNHDCWQYQVSEKDNPPKSLTFGWQRSQLLGAFFNGVLLLGWGLSIFQQSIERFVSLRR